MSFLFHKLLLAVKCSTTLFFRNKLQIAKVDMMPIISGFRIKSGTRPPRVYAVYTNICMYVHPFKNPATCLHKFSVQRSNKELGTVDRIKGIVATMEGKQK
jgi:hypothetical protein